MTVDFLSSTCFGIEHDKRIVEIFSSFDGTLAGIYVQNDKEPFGAKNGRIVKKKGARYRRVKGAIYEQVWFYPNMTTVLRLSYLPGNKLDLIILLSESGQLCRVKRTLGPEGKEYLLWTGKDNTTSRYLYEPNAT